ncbi:MAG: hypothetical protein GX288_10400 [Clostridiales bacterium]|nr:hypothetical protein [Clostridiales bacterium]
MILMKKRKNLLLSLLLIFFSFLALGQKSNANAKATLQVAKIDKVVNEVVEAVDSTITYDLWGYSAKVSPISEFFDYEGNYNTIYESENKINLVKYSKDFKSIRTYSTEKPYPLFGGAISDSQGNYYIVYGQNNETDHGHYVVLSVVKYDSDFKYVSEVQYTGAETGPYPGLEWGTKLPFDAGNCDIALNGNILVCTYAREMYNGHQSNHVIFVDIDTMTKVNHAGSYTSHSFDQRVLVTESGNYLFVDHGDAFDRGFKISSVLKGSTNIWDTLGYVSFHFREGADRAYGYNETYAQLAGMAEIETGYVLAGASEKTLSLEPAPTSRNYCGYSEARNLFIQILDKNFMYLSGEDAHVLKTEVRKATGTRPASAKTNLYLEGNEINYGVLWLTDYSHEYCVVNPKLVTTEDDRIVLLWEKFKYGDDYEWESYIDSYYMILSKDGEVIQDETSLRGTRLTEHEAPVYRDNKVYFSTLDGYNDTLVLNILYLGETITLTEIKSFQHNKIENQNYTGYYIEPEVTIKLNNKTLKQGIDYELEYSDNLYPGKASITVRGIGAYYGEKDIYFYIKPDKPEIYSLTSNKKGSFTFYAGNDTYDDIQIVYSTDSKFKSKKTINKNEGTVSKLASNKTYYVKARAYITVDGKKIYSSYSKTYKIKVR